ncbi:MAG: zinc-dependent metalloprotease [Bacteroidetes bacterium]|nr:zinc-dependent metalloprotease [Bacteroidota bacterium]
MNADSIFKPFLLAALFSTSLVLQAQQPPPGAMAARADTSSRPASPNARQTPAGPRPFAEVITKKAVTDKGMFTVHKVDDKYFFELPDSLMMREILVVNRVSKAPAGLQGSPLNYAGDQLSQKVVRFEKGPSNKVFLRTISYADYTPDSTSPMFRSVNNSNLQPITASFDIRAFTMDSGASVIETTELINGDNEVFYLANGLKTSARIGALQADRSYVTSVKSYPVNVEVKAVKSYAMSQSPSGGGLSGILANAGTPPNITTELNSSWLLLPKTPMQSRYFDPRVGYFEVGYTDYDLNPQGIKEVSLIKRWRLEPRLADMEKYRKGELVEPEKPIVFYIDPTTPEKWIPYLIQGVNDWQKAFEKAGFRNAIQARRAPSKQENPDWSLEDARHSAIVYKPSSTPNASGPSIADPRSGEIMESHINWYHNVMLLLRNWYFIQASPNDPGARKMEFDDELMGQLIRFVSSHEVGHTLGLRHNFGASASVPVEKLRDKVWVETNGHTPSIMDYARFNYVAQPEDGITRAGIFPRIGPYDEWAIEWGYRRFPDWGGPRQEKAQLNTWVIDRLKDKRLWFGDGETYRDDPRNLTEQVGDDAVKGSVYGIQNLQRIMPKLIEWTKKPAEGYEGLTTMYGELVRQFERYNGHVIARIGGLRRTPRTVDESGPVFEPESRVGQKEAIRHLNRHLFQTPAWLLHADVFQRTGKNGLETVGSLQESALRSILKRPRLDNLVKANTLSRQAEPYPVYELLDDLKAGIWNELTTSAPIDVYRRQLQQVYLERLDAIINSKQITPTGDLAVLASLLASQGDPDGVDVTASVRHHLKALQSDVRRAGKTATDRLTRIHLEDMDRRITKSLKPDEK